MFRIRVMQLSDAMKKFILSAIMFLCALSSPAQTIDIEQLSGGNTLVRIGADEKSKYLLLPIEEKAPEASVRVICGND